MIKDEIAVLPFLNLVLWRNFACWWGAMWVKFLIHILKTRFPITVCWFFYKTKETSNNAYYFYLY